MLTTIQLKKMLELQDSMNRKVNPAWKLADNDWLLAAALEGAEAIEHHGWKWWKHQKPDMAQFQMELVDIWHFALSHTIVEAIKLDDNEVELLSRIDYPIFFNDGNYYYQRNSLIDNTKLLIGLAMSGEFDAPLFFHICEQANLPVEDLYKQYLSKNVLNFFRQDNGYKDGSYVKVWFDDREDNEHLVEIMDACDMNAPDVDKVIYANLKQRYQQNF